MAVTLVDVIVPGAGAGTTSLGLPGSRALVVGTGSHPPDSRLPDLPAVERTVAAVSEALVERCGLGRDHVRALTDPADPKAFLGALTGTAVQAEDVLLLYYIGHGLVSMGGELYLATQDTSDQDIRLAVEALSYSTVREALTGCRARAIMVVLDCSPASCAGSRPQQHSRAACANSHIASRMSGRSTLPVSCFKRCR